MSTEGTPAPAPSTTEAPAVTTTEATTTTPATVETTTPPTTETQTPASPAEPAKVEEAKAAVEEPAKATEPPAYSLKPSDGSLLNQDQATAVETLAKSANLTEAQAKEILTNQEAAVKAYDSQLHDSFKRTVEGWTSEVKTDKELGGANLGQTMARTKQALDQFADPQLQRDLESSGYGNHPGLVRMLERIGKAMGDNTAFVKSTTTTSAPKRPQDILYGNSSKK